MGCDCGKAQNRRRKTVNASFRLDGRPDRFLQLNRLQNTLQIMLGEAATGAVGKCGLWKENEFAAPRALFFISSASSTPVLGAGADL